MLQFDRKNSNIFSMKIIQSMSEIKTNVANSRKNQNYNTEKDMKEKCNFGNSSVITYSKFCRTKINMKQITCYNI